MTDTDRLLLCYYCRGVGNPNPEPVVAFGLCERHLTYV